MKTFDEIREKIEELRKKRKENEHYGYNSMYDSGYYEALDDLEKEF